MHLRATAKEEITLITADVREEKRIGNTHESNVPIELPEDLR